MLAALINGCPASEALHAVSIEERGLAYGDGLFETMLLHAGGIRFLTDHLARLRLGGARLGISVPDERVIRSDIANLIRSHQDGIVKIIITRGAGGRGYRPSDSLKPTRIAMLYPPPTDDPRDGIVVRWCTTRLARNSQLAGIKHLNRLEQVMAQNEWRDPSIAEGLMLDTEGEVIGATTSNVFIVADGVLTTPDLRFSGVRGVMRGRALEAANSIDIETRESELRPEDIHAASEVFLTNAVRGIRSVSMLGERQFRSNSVAQRLTAAIKSMNRVLTI